MKKNYILNPTSFLFGHAAEKAIEHKMALPFLGQNKIAFSMVEKISLQNTQIETLPSFLKGKDERYDLNPFITPLPLANLPAGPIVMGILNVTPDSFSDGGKHFALSSAIRAGQQMIQEGAALIDIGGESTRPGSHPVTIEEECRRIIPVIKALKGCGAFLSVDTRHAQTMQRALEAGADLINDISALDDPHSAAIIAQAQCPVILMHMRGNPQTMGEHTMYQHVLIDVVCELQDKIAKAIKAGIRRENIIIDPGIGFAKTYTQNMMLLKNLPIFANLGCRVLLAVSRKRFIKEIVGDMPYNHYDSATIIASSLAGCFGQEIIRVHNVPAMVQALKMWHAFYG